MHGFIEIKRKDGMRDSIRTDMISNFWEEKHGNSKQVKLVLMNDYESPFDYPGTYEELQRDIARAEYPNFGDVDLDHENEGENQ
ncbi:hypothetical protein NIE88_21930, partial [Sporolactobacillus shoreicorticis]|uniref:Uncharacterized protein n=1 Tax=Sporolactobacillus shoreicorticis TaxID=1923877 RepID=A0ABW5RYT4_9BACL